MADTKQQGYSLVEMTMVFVMMAAFSAMVLSGNDLLRIAELRNVITDVQRYNTIINGFKLNYGGLPGDLTKTCLQVLAVLFGSKASKKIYSMKQVKKELAVTGEDKILSLLGEKGALGNKEIAAALGISHATCWRMLDKLEAEGKVKKAGVGRGISYTLL